MLRKRLRTRQWVVPPPKHDPRLSLGRELRIEHSGQRDPYSSGDSLADVPGSLNPIASQDSVMLDHSVEQGEVPGYQAI